MTNATPPEIEIDVVEHGPNGPVYDVSYDRTHQPTLVVVTALATIEEVEPTELQPLHDAIDADALDRLLEGAWRRPSPVTVSFTFEGYHVEYRQPGTVRLEPTAESTTA